MPKTKSFFVHLCELPPTTNFARELIPEETLLARIQRLFIRSVTISTNNVRAQRYFRSTTAIEFERARHMKNGIRCVHPFSTFRFIWNTFMIFVYLFALFVIPIYVAFIVPSFERPHGWLACDFVQCFFCTLDITVNCMTGYVQDEERIVILPWKNFVHYLLTYFTFDVLSTIPADHLFCQLSGHCSYICEEIAPLRLLKYVRLLTVQQYITYAAETVNMPYMVVEGLWMAILAFYVIHLLCCLQYYVARILVESQPYIWVVDQEVYPKDSVIYKYIISVFRTSAASFNLGYGLQVPKSTVDEGITIIVAIIGNILVIIAIGKVLQWAYITHSSSALYFHMMQQLDSYMIQKKLPKPLKYRLIEYYEFRYQENIFQESEILSTLSSQLRQEIVIHGTWRLIENVSFFNNLPSTLLTRIAVCLQPEYFLANDVIVKAGSLGDAMYFISLGTVAVYTLTGKEVCHLEDGTHFGEIALVLGGQRRVASVVAVESCELYRLQGAEFKRAISAYPDLMARIERIAEERYERTTQLDEKNRRERTRPAKRPPRK